MNVVGQLMHVLKFATDCTTLYNSVVFNLLTGQNGKYKAKTSKSILYHYIYIRREIYSKYKSNFVYCSYSLNMEIEFYEDLVLPSKKYECKIKFSSLEYT